MANGKVLLLTALFLTVFFTSFSQVQFDQSLFLDARMLVDTTSYQWSENTVRASSRKALAFSYTNENEVAEVYLYYDGSVPVSNIDLLPSTDFDVVDSLILFGDYARFKVKFNGLTNTNFLKFIFQVTRNQDTRLVELPLQPFTNTYVELYSGANDLFIGEEKVIELTTNNSKNIVVDNRWTEGLPIDYRVTRESSRIFLHLLPNELGRQEINVNFTTKQPLLTGQRLSYELETLKADFRIKAGRLAFLQFDQQEITPKDDKTEAIEIQLDNHRLLRLNKTYRIEAQEETGGALIAEVFTKTRLNNDRILCLLRPYAFHRKSRGYLYIKDGDNAKFVTNLDITPKTNITSISIQRQGRDWEKGNQVYPGETINVKLEGEGLHKASFSFPGATGLLYDSLLKIENLSIFKIQIPLNISSKRVEIFNHNKATGKSLSIAEYQQPKEFDFIELDLGNNAYVLSDIEKPIYHENTLTDLVFNFNQNKIDSKEQLYGKQYLTIGVKISNKRGNLIELYQFDNVIICPGSNSPRFAYYDPKSCKTEDINLNNFLSKKTSDLEEWSRIELNISHQKDKYGGDGRSKKVLIHLKRDYNFDIDVSFPAGLLILKANQDNFTNFGGVSLAMIAQMSFYQPGKIAKKRPYKVGAGFIAIDAFNFSENASNRDVGLVVIGSLYPTSSDNKLTFPLYMGGGYLLSERKPFFLIGPGIRVRF